HGPRRAASVARAAAMKRPQMVAGQVPPETRPSAAAPSAPGPGVAAPHGRGQLRGEADEPGVGVVLGGAGLAGGRPPHAAPHPRARPTHPATTPTTPRPPARRPPAPPRAPGPPGPARPPGGRGGPGGAPDPRPPFPGPPDREGSPAAHR